MLTRLGGGHGVGDAPLHLGEVFPDEHLELVRLPGRLLRVPAARLRVVSHHGEGLAQPHQAPQLRSLPGYNETVTSTITLLSRIK